MIRTILNFFRHFELKLNYSTQLDSKSEKTKQNNTTARRTKSEKTKQNKPVVEVVYFVKFLHQSSIQNHVLF